jgi:hypothetical protein
MRNGRDDGRESVYCGAYGRGRKAVLEKEQRGKIREPRRPQIINKAALTIIGNRTAQYSVYVEVRRERGEAKNSR